MRLLPRSLLGQMILLMGLALFIAQAVNFNLLLSGQQRLNLAQIEGPAIARFVQTASLVTASGPAALADRPPGPPDRPRRRRAFSVDPASIVVEGARRDPRLEARLVTGLREAGVPFRRVRARSVPDSEAFPRLAERRRERGGPPRQLIMLSAELPDGQWINGRVPMPRADPFLIWRLSLSTLALYILVLGAVLWIAFRITRPLRDLTRAAERFEGRQDLAPVEPRGPMDLRRAIQAFNAMNRRVTGLLDEKDRMLGAIGHDLRTPLASLRIRAEAMEPEAEREALVRTIEEMSATLEDILVLARTGRSREAARLVDLAALADSAVEEFRALGHEVMFEDSPRQPRAVQPNLLRRAVRNLIDNAVNYGGRARVRVAAEGEGAAIEVDDDGPGLPADRIDHVLRPFERLEESRSRDTGGAGLGLAIARAVAESHGGTLTLVNRTEGGLRARLVVASGSEPGRV